MGYGSTSPRTSFQLSALATNLSPKVKDQAAAASAPGPRAPDQHHGTDHLVAKANKIVVVEDWVRALHVHWLMVAINVSIKDAPPRKVKTDLTMKDLDGLDYGPITINGRVCGGKLHQILVRLYFLPDEAHHALGTKFEIVDLDITPGDDAESTDALDKTLEII
ncbi:hypothetical protein K438DRAFT_2027325 [Mycena galopus ATCC 62051]|nr:hypothetical protein K438DRAFT_2027325 [Mycena galopus ATCC 62051]